MQAIKAEWEFWRDALVGGLVLGAVVLGATWAMLWAAAQGQVLPPGASEVVGAFAGRAGFEAATGAFARAVGLGALAGALLALGLAALRRLAGPLRRIP